jgi:hypothetical protein
VNICNKTDYIEAQNQKICGSKSIGITIAYNYTMTFDPLARCTNGKKIQLFLVHAS